MKQGIISTAYKLRNTLTSYIEAQYHIRNERLIQERKNLLDSPGTIWQQPYVESTPVYRLGPELADLKIPGIVAKKLTELSKIGDAIGVYPRPYEHQASALEAFFNDNSPSDIIIATGTGSGKTEGFLYPIIGHLAMESNLKASTANMRGVRALLLYPMNSLVSDQLSRIRKLFGNEDAARLLSEGRNRVIQFGSYTGRTPYPGMRTASKDRENFKSIFEDYYLPALSNKKLLEKLKAAGKWPSKDIAGYYGKPGGWWEKRLHTQPADRELFSRHEMQESCPDILITNYSMLEYMLMRPIEQQIFESTKQWLASDPTNSLILVLDEAHMYRGAGGAEVALLIRRLGARLNIKRERMRCILTSASLGSGEEAKSGIIEFAQRLTGSEETEGTTFKLITGVLEQLPKAYESKVGRISKLAQFDLLSLENYAAEPTHLIEEIRLLSTKLGWAPLNGDKITDARDHLYQCLETFEPFQSVSDRIVGTAIELEDLAQVSFPTLDRQLGLACLQVVLGLATFARRKSDNRVLLPTRLHLMFRGLSGLFACTNNVCPCASSVSNDFSILGRLFSTPRTVCDCSEQSRVYELMTHRECGSAFLRGYIDGLSGEFLWHEPSGRFLLDQVGRLNEVEILVESEPNIKALNCTKRWLDPATGKLVETRPSNESAYLQCHLPLTSVESGGIVSYSFDKCPICLKGRRGEKLLSMDHATKSEAPFANLVKQQLLMQPAAKKETNIFPNGGRKVLIFSDGRQKAARLARDVPREVESDVFRQAISVAVKELEIANGEARITKDLYTSFIRVLAKQNLRIFDGEDLKFLKSHIKNYESDEYETLREALDNFEEDPPFQFKKLLLEQLCGRFYGFWGTTVGFVEPSKAAFRSLTKKLSDFQLEAEEIRAIGAIWIAKQLDGYSFDPNLDNAVRYAASPFNKLTWGSNGLFRKSERENICTILRFDQAKVSVIENVLKDCLMGEPKNNEYFLRPTKLKITIDLNHSWVRCSSCTNLSPLSLRKCCVYCGSNHVDELEPAFSPYLKARKDFWRNPVEEALGSSPLHAISVEEHTAQLSNRDRSSAHPTTEKYELQFQDVLVSADDRPIDVLSCTTTMEVGVDIGSLVAVGLRNVPPQRENYQQRAGRSGRRGSAVSTVVTFGQNGPHDGYYFNNPKKIVAGDPRVPEIKTDNPKIARRHVHSYLFQTFFQTRLLNGEYESHIKTAVLHKSLGLTTDFFHGTGIAGFDFLGFSEWIEQKALSEPSEVTDLIASWLPNLQGISSSGKPEWVRSISKDLLRTLKEFEPQVIGEITTDDSTAHNLDEKSELLEFLFNKGLLPTYAFPTDLSSFLVEDLVATKGGGYPRLKEKERPQLSLDKALSEYAPGRLIVINKETFRSRGVTASFPNSKEYRARELFDSVSQYSHCNSCNYVGDVTQKESREAICPVCESQLESRPIITPEVFTPENGKNLNEKDRDQQFTYATMAQFPIPANEKENPDYQPLGQHLSFSVVTDQKLVRVNKGKNELEGHSGFWVCSDCGFSDLELPEDSRHHKPYLPQPTQQSSSTCGGEFRQVYLGHVFSTDLLLLRFSLNAPMITDVADLRSLAVYEDALYSIAEAIRLAASRHRQLDIDPSEFGSGFRILPKLDDTLKMEVYIYDTLSGGAGYAELAGKYLNEIIDDAIHILKNCPSMCDSSCVDCLRNFYNQHISERLDRGIACELLEYVKNGEISAEPSFDDQLKALSGLRRLLELDGFECETAELDGIRIPLLVSNSNRQIAVGLRSGIVDENMIDHSLESLNFETKALDEYLLKRNLPDHHQQIRVLLQPNKE